MSDAVEIQSAVPAAVVVDNGVETNEGGDVEIKGVIPDVGVDKDGNRNCLIKYENDTGTMPSPDDKYIGVTENQLLSVTKTTYGKCNTASVVNIYNHEDIRAVHIDKAPFNDFYHISKFQIHDISKESFHSLKNALTLPLTQNTYIYHELYNIVVWVGLFLTIFFLFDLGTPQARKEMEGYEQPASHQMLGIIGLIFVLVYLPLLLLQFFRPKVFARIDTSRWGGTWFSWSNLSEYLVFMGKGPGISVKSEDDIGEGIIGLNEDDEQILQRWKGKGVKDIQTQELILTNKRVSVRRSSFCCCGKILRADSLSSYKLEEISSTTADESYPLWWVVATCYFVIIIIWDLIASGEHKDWQNSLEGIHKYQNYVMRRQILYFTVFAFFVIASGMAGGIGYCRRAFVVIYFKGPRFLPFLFTSKYEVLELPIGGASGVAENIARSVMTAKEKRMKEKYGLKMV